MIDPLFSMALVTGLLGSGHCIGMCGGIVAALAVSSEGRRGGVTFQLLYQAGRIATYVFIGFLVGWLGSAIAYTDAFAGATRVVLLGSDLFIILIGLGTAGCLPRLNVMQLDFASAGRWLGTAVARLRRLPAALSALPLGLLMGFLPCGFLYAMAIAAAQSASPWRGALTLLGFGLGTAPALFCFGNAAHWLSMRARTWMLRGAGLMVAIMGAYNLYQHWQLLG